MAEENELVKHHKKLHAGLDELMAICMAETGKRLSTTTVLELMKWSKDRMDILEVTEPPDQQGTIEILRDCLCDLLVCTDLTDPVEIARRANLSFPTGTSGKWKVMEEPKFPNGDRHPGECANKSGKFKHYLLRC